MATLRRKLEQRCSWALPSLLVLLTHEPGQGEIVHACRRHFIGVWDTVGSLGLPLGSTAAKVHSYRFLDTHLRLDNEYAFHALALDEHRHNFEPTFWTRTIKTGEGAPPDRPIEHVEQRWFIGAHANVGGGYASDPLLK